MFVHPALFDLAGLFKILVRIDRSWRDPLRLFPIVFPDTASHKTQKESVALGFFMVYAKEDRKRGKQVGTGNLCVYRTSSRAFSLWLSRRASGLCPLKKCHWANDCGPGRAGCDYVYQRDGAGSGSVGSAGSIAAKRGKSGDPADRGAALYGSGAELADGGSKGI